MATVAKNKMFSDVHNAENWKYTTTNNIKTFNNKEDAKRFLSGTGKIWKLENYKDGITFMQSLLQSIDELHQNNTVGFEYVDEKGDVCYILFLIQMSSDGKSLQISHTQHRLSRSGARKNANDNVHIEECHAGRWLMQRACDEVHLPEQTAKAMVSQKYNTLEHRTPNYQFEAYDMSLKEIDQIIEISNSTLSQKENHHYAHKNRYVKQFLLSIPEISNFCKRMSESDAFSEHLISQIQNVHGPKEFLYHLQYPNGEKCTLHLMVKPDRDYIHMWPELQIGNTGSQK